MFYAKEKVHKYFQRKDENIFFTARLTKKQFKTINFTLMIPTLENDFVQFTPKRQVKLDDAHIFEGRGLPIMGDPNNRGALILRFETIDDAAKGNLC